MRPPRVHRDVPVRSAFSAIACVTGHREAKRQMITTTGFGKTVSSHSELVSTGVGLPPRDTPSPSMFSTDDEVACLTGVMEPNYVRPVPLHLPLAPSPSARSRSHRSGRSSLSRVSKGSHFTSASQRSLINANELVRDVLHQTAQIEERRTQAEQERLQALAQAERNRIEVAARAERDRQQLEERRLQAEREVEERRIQAE